MSELSQAVAEATNQSSVPAKSAEVESQEAQESEENQEVEAESSEEEELEDKEPKKEAKPEKAKSKAEKELEKRIKKLKLKVDGREIEEEIDLDDDERLIRELQMAKMGQKRAQEKAELEKELQAFFKAMKDDPFAILANELQMNPEEIIEQYINKQLEQAKKSPEQLEKERLEAELRSIREEREREKQEAQQRELERLQQQEFERYDILMEQALTKSSLPKTPYAVKRIADYMLVDLEAGYDVTPEDVIPLVEQELNSDLKELFSALPEEQIEALLGEQVLNKLRKRRVAKAQQAQKAVAKPSVVETGVKKDNSPKEKEKISYKDFFKM